MKLLCIIGDVVQSRSVHPRARLQAQLQKTLTVVNRRRRKQLISPCTITLGDEFQAVYRDASSLFNDFWMVMHDVYPVKVRFSVGIGLLSTPINRQQAIGMDGPAFHAARTGLTELKASHYALRISEPDATVPPWINLTLDLISHANASWKQNRLSVFQKLLEGREPKVIAEDIGITTAAVYKNMQSGALGTTKSLLHEIADWINSRRDAK